MKSIWFTTLMFVSFITLACNQSPKTKTTKTTVVKKIQAAAPKQAAGQVIELLGPAEFQKQIQASGVQLVDVRTAREFQQGHIKGAIFYDFYKKNSFMTNMNTLDKSKPVYIYCLTGARSRSTAQKLKRNGFSKIYDLKNGVKSWYRSGLKLVR